MSNIKNINNKEWVFFTFIKTRTESLGFRVFMEAICSFLLIFIINFGITLGEVDISVFNLIYNVNLFNAMWIGALTLLSFYWMRKTTISSNVLNLVGSIRNKNIDKKEFCFSVIGQLIGGIIAATIVFLIVSMGINSSQETLIMGGTTPAIKGLFLSNPDMFGFDAIWEPVVFITTGSMFGFAAIQGLVNAFAISFAFMLNRSVDNKFDNDKKVFLLRYIILVVIISLTTIMYANTTNWIRLLSPALISQIDSWATGGTSIVLWTTLTFMLFQIMGFIFVFASRNFLEDK